jgi:hypothetical protein
MSVKEFFYQQDSSFLIGYFRQYIQRNVVSKNYTKRIQRIAINKLVDTWPNNNEKEILRKASLEFL